MGSISGQVARGLLSHSATMLRLTHPGSNARIANHSILRRFVVAGLVAPMALRLRAIWSTEGEHVANNLFIFIVRLAGYSKRPRLSPGQPRRAKTRHSTGKAAASEEMKRTLFRTLSL